MHRFIVALVTASLMALAGTALTKTPDQQTPSTETACDGLSRSARGICNAYCEAQDCDSHPKPSASCERLRANFQRQTGSKVLPCDRPACGGAEFPTCDGTCPEDLVCASGPENGGPDTAGPQISGSDNEGVACSCRTPCGDTTAPQCGGGCPGGLVCASGAENGGPEAGGADGTAFGPCECQIPCGSATAPQCDGGCPFGGLCVSGAEAGGTDRQAIVPDGCVCRFIITIP
jgi:hypothetical protein